MLSKMFIKNLSMAERVSYEDIQERVVVRYSQHAGKHLKLSPNQKR